MNIGELVAILRVRDRDYNRQVDNAGNRFVGLGNRLRDTATRTRGHLTTIGAGAADAARRIDSALGGVPSRVLSPIGTAASAAGNGMQRAFGPALNSVRAGFDGAGASGNRFHGTMYQVGAAASAVAGTASTMGSAFSRGFAGPTVEATRLGSTMAAVGGATRSALSTAQAAAVGFGSRLREAANSSRSSVGGLGDSVRGVTTQLGVLAGAVGIAKIGGDVVRLTNQLDGTRRVMEGLYGDTQVAGDMMDRLARLSSSSSLGHENFLAAGESLAYLGISGDRAEKMLRNLDAATTVAGTGAQGMQSAMYALTGATNSGRVQLDHLNQISHSGVPIFNQLQNQLGVTAEELKKMASDGKISVSDLETAFETASGPLWSDMVEASGNASASLTNQWATFRGNFVTGVATALQPAVQRAGAAFVGLNERTAPFFQNLDQHIAHAKQLMDQWGITDALRNIGEQFKVLAGIAGPFLQGALIGLAGAIGAIIHGVSLLLTVISPLTNYLAENEWIAKSLGVTFGVLLGAMLGAKGAVMAAGLAFKLLGPFITAGRLAVQLFQSTIVRTAVVFAAKLVFMLAKAAVWAVAMAAKWLIAMGPIGWIIAAVVALVAVIIYNWDAIKEWTINAWSAVSEWVTQKWEELKEAVQAGADWVNQKTVDAWNACVEWTRNAWNSVVTWISDSWSKIVSTVQSWGQRAVDFCRDAWERARQMASDAWARVVQVLQDSWSKIVSTVQSWGQRAVDFVRNAWDRARQMCVDAWARIVDSVRSGADRAITFVRELPGRILSALGNLGTLLWNSGSALVQGFLDGISANWQRIVGFVQQGMSQLRALWPFSPAKEGPFSGSGYVTHSGKALTSDFAKSLRGGMPGIIASARDIVDAAHGELNAKLPAGLGGSGSSPGLPGHAWLSRDRGPRRDDGSSPNGGGDVIVNINNPAAERSSASLNRSARALAVLGPWRDE